MLECSSRQLRIQFDFELQSLGLGLGGVIVGQFGNQFSDVDRRHLDLQFAALGPAERRQVIDHISQEQHLVVGFFESLLDGVHVAGFVDDKLGVADIALGDGDRRAQFVADDADELVALLLQRFLTGDIA